MKVWKWVVLIFELWLFAVILVLPQVELPAVTFHGGSAPVATRTRMSVPVRAPAAVLTLKIWLPGLIQGTPVEATHDLFGKAADSRLSLLCTLLC